MQLQQWIHGQPLTILSGDGTVEITNICDDSRRNRDQVLVVEQPHDVATIEAIGLFKGVYHVLMGRLAPLDGIGPDELNIHALLDR